MPWYPKAQHAPWKWNNSYYPNANEPIAAVLHIMQGWMPTVLEWARTGYNAASWHFSVGRDGAVYQHLDIVHGGFHAGITDAQARKYPPTWRLWKGPGINVNTYTVGIEHEGMSGKPFTEPQRQASKELCQWLAAEFGWPFERDRFPAHADIDRVNRVNDFAPPAMREEYYRWLFAPDEPQYDDLEVLRKGVRDALALVQGLESSHRKRMHKYGNMAMPWMRAPKTMSRNEEIALLTGALRQMHDLLRETDAEELYELGLIREELGKWQA